MGSEEPRVPSAREDTSFCFPMKWQGGTKEGVTHAGRSGVPSLSLDPEPMGSKKAWKVNIGPWAQEKGALKLLGSVCASLA